MYMYLLLALIHMSIIKKIAIIIWKKSSLVRHKILSGSLAFYGFPRERIFHSICNKTFCFYMQLSEIADGVWCPVRVKALISSVASRTALACSILSVFLFFFFHQKEKLAGKRLMDLDQKVIATIAGNFKKEEARILINFCAEKKANISIQQYKYQWFKNNYQLKTLKRVQIKYSSLWK